MNALTQLAARSRVTVIDDDADGRDDLMDQLAAPCALHVIGFPSA